jgi:hypothetical protein
MVHFFGGFESATYTFCESSHNLNRELREPAKLLAVSYALLGRDDDVRRILAGYPSYWTSFGMLQRLMRDFPFKNPKIVDRVVEGFVKSGLSTHLPSFYNILDKSRLTGQQIRKLVFDRKVIGLEGWFERGNDGSAVYRGHISGFDRGQSWIENDLLCNQWQKRFGGRKICYPVFHNPEGKFEKQDEYLYITDLKIYPFSTAD